MRPEELEAAIYKLCSRLKVVREEKKISRAKMASDLIDFGVDADEETIKRLEKGLFLDNFICKAQLLWGCIVVLEMEDDVFQRKKVLLYYKAVKEIKEIIDELSKKLS